MKTRKQRPLAVLVAALALAAIVPLAATAKSANDSAHSPAEAQASALTALAASEVEPPLMDKSKLGQRKQYVVEWGWIRVVVTTIECPPSSKPSCPF